MTMQHPLEMIVQERIAEKSYSLAEARGFVSGQEQQDWEEAQRLVAGEIKEDLANIRAGTYECTTPLEQALHQRIAEVAYECAKERGFAPGKEMDDWLAAEDQVATEIQAVLPEAMVSEPAAVMPETAQSGLPV